MSNKGSSNRAKLAKTLPRSESPGFDLPDGFEARISAADDLGMIVRLGTDKKVGFVPSRFDPARINELLARL